MKTLGVLFLIIGCLVLVCVMLISWHHGVPRSFWVSQLTYQNKELQNFVRRAWGSAWLLNLLGAILGTLSDEHLADSFLWSLANVLWLLLAAYLMSRVVTAIILFMEAFGDLFSLRKK